MRAGRLVADHTWRAGRWATADELLAGGADEVTRVAGTVVPGLRDHHVHLGLVDRDALAGSSLSAVDDLGWIPEESLSWRAQGVGGCAVRVAGPFLTAPGGYPTGRSWAPPGSVVAVASPDRAAAAVRELVAAGVDLIKVTLHTGMPLLDETCLTAIVAAAHARRRPVVVHAEGPGQARRALAAGADALAHTPWTESLSDEVLAAMASSLTWISTLAIHPAGSSARATAVDNLARFARAGGRVRYGTDLGNGPNPVGYVEAEATALVEAGMDLPAVLEAIGRAQPTRATLPWTPDEPPDHVRDLPAWLATLRRRAIPDLEGKRMTVDTPLAPAAQLDAADPLAPFRRHFAGDEEGVIAYLDGNSLGRPVVGTADRLTDFVTGPWGSRLIRSWDESWMDEPQVVGDRLGEVVLGAAPGQVVVGDSTSVLIYKLLRAAVDLDPTRTEIVIDRDNFPTDRYLLQGVAAERGLTVRWIDVDQAAGVRAADLEGVLGDRTAVVVLSHVAYRSGFLADARAITASVHRAGALVLWDLSHSVGSVPIALDEWGVDLAAGCTYKYLNGGPGSPAFCYVRSELQERLQQPIWGWIGADDVFAFGPEYTPAPGVRRFLSGTPPILAMQPMRLMLELIAEAGMSAVRAKSILLTERAVVRTDEQLTPFGVTLASPRDPAERGSHVTVRHPGFRDVTAKLWERGVIPDFRGPDNLRIGLSPLSTSFAELDRGLGAIRDALEELTTS